MSNLAFSPVKSDLGGESVSLLIISRSAAAAPLEARAPPAHAPRVNAARLPVPFSSSLHPSHSSLAPAVPCAPVRHHSAPQGHQEGEKRCHVAVRGRLPLAPTPTRAASDANVMHVHRQTQQLRVAQHRRERGRRQRRAARRLDAQGEQDAERPLLLHLARRQDAVDAAGRQDDDLRGGGCSERNSSSNCVGSSSHDCSSSSYRNSSSGGDSSAACAAERCGCVCVTVAVAARRRRD